MKLVENWKTAWKWVSIQIAIIAAGLQGAVLAFPNLDKWLGDENTHWVGLAMLLSIVFGRLVDQTKPSC